MSLLELQYFSRQGGESTPIRKLRDVTSYRVLSGDKIILVDTSKSSVKLLLPSASGVQAGSTISVKDSSGDALTNNIAIVCKSGDTLDGQAIVILNADYAGVKLMSDGANWLLSP